MVNNSDAPRNLTRLPSGSWPVQHALARRAHRLFDILGDNGDQFWRRGLNRNSAALHRTNPLPLTSGPVRAAADALKQEGIARLHLSDLTRGGALLEGLLAEEQRIETAIAGDVAERREALRSGDSTNGKDYVVRTLPSAGAELDFDAFSVRVALHPEILAIVNSALGMYSELRLLSFWHTLTTPDKEAVSSQLWHRDPEDLNLVKIFVYLDEVDEGSGPFSFVEGTHAGELRHQDPPRLTPKSANRFDDAEMNRLVDNRKWRSETGSTGTVVLAMTKGFHKGGLAVTSDRRLLAAAYLSPWSQDYFLPFRISNIGTDTHPAVRFAAGDQNSAK